MPKGHALTKKQTNKILKQRAKGMSYTEIAEEHGLAAKTVSRLVNEHAPELGSKRADTIRIEREDGAAPAKKTKKKAKTKKKGKKPGPKPGTKYLTLKDENDYLRWAYNGAVNGWVDRLIAEHANGKLG